MWFECGQNKYYSRLEMHKKLMWMEVNIHSVKAKGQAGNIWVKDIMTTEIYICILPENSA